MQANRLKTITALVSICAVLVGVAGEYNGPLAEKRHVFSGVRRWAQRGVWRSSRLRKVTETLREAWSGSPSAAAGQVKPEQMK